ncbi:MAG: thiamine ABC transporter substrate-binding protein [Treponema sp.]|nr:thiamine ABC transporter substrate-binding protein [Treponema sp.]
MKKNHFYLTLILCILISGCFFVGCKKTDKAADSRKNEVIVYTYDSFSGEWGAGPEIARLFEEKTGIKVTYADCGDSGQILSKAVLEKASPYADVLIGIDNNLSEQALESGIIYQYKPQKLDEIVPADITKELNSGKNTVSLVPYDFSDFAFIFNTLSGLPTPTCLEDLTKPVYKNKIILMDPRTSTPGLGFKCWAEKVYGSDYDAYMKRLEPSILTMAPSWSVGYGMFTKGEAPLVISYTTSAAYHIEYDEGDQFKALKFTDGHIRQIEGACIVKNAPNLAGAKKFMDFLISDEAQNIIPLTQWMFPSNKNVKLPASYSAAF